MVSASLQTLMLSGKVTLTYMATWSRRDLISSPAHTYSETSDKGGPTGQRACDRWDTDDKSTCNYGLCCSSLVEQHHIEIIDFSLPH